MGFRQPISANCNDCLVVMDSFTQILEAKGDIKAAIPILQKGAILDPESRAIQQVTCTPPTDRYVIEHKFSPIHVACDWFSVVTVQMHHEITAWGTQRKGHVPENAGPNTKTRNERQTFQSRSSRCTKSKCFTRFSLNRKFEFNSFKNSILFIGFCQQIPFTIIYSSVCLSFSFYSSNYGAT